jgi:hypothetical protein
VATCGFCGKASDPTDPEAAPPLTWTTSVENGKERVYCDQCSREHLRAIESKLDSEWW